MTYGQIKFTTQDPVAFLTLNQPGKINALSQQMISEMIHALTGVSSEEDIKVVIIRAEGKHFCAGHDLSEMVDGGVKEGKVIFDRCTELMRLIHAMPQPVGR